MLVSKEIIEEIYHYADDEKIAKANEFLQNNSIKNSC